MKKFLLGFVLVFAALFTNVSAEDNPRAVIIFDASGSMWGQINGVTKIEIARDALKNVVKEWNPNVELGLTVYGHRSKGDCDDIETVIPVGKIDKDKVISTVMDIKPKGKTPISRSLRKVAEEIKYTEEKATIILISDGKETCDPDPCGTAKELEKQGIDFVTHVIGFNVDKKTDAQLECIASATGGEYFSAKNAAALNEAMKVIAKKVEVAEPAPEPKPVVKKLKNNLEVSVSETESGKWVRSYVYIYPVINGEKEDSTISSMVAQKKKPATTKLPVGKYVVQAKYNKFPDKFTEFEIKPGETTKVHVAMGQTGNVEISVSEEEGGKWVQASVYIYPVVDGAKEDSTIASTTARKKKPATAQLPAGKYVVQSRYNKFPDKFTEFEIKPGETTKVHVAMGQTGKVEISVSEKEGGKWVRSNVYIYPVVDGVKEDSTIASTTAHKKEAAMAQLPAGKYVVTTKYNNLTKEIPFEIKAGKTTKVHMTFGQFFMGAKCSNGGAKVNYEIYAANGQLVYEKEMACSDTWKMTLDDGDYSVEAKIDSGTGEAKFSVGSGHPNKLILDLTNLNHEEEIKADNQAPTPVVVKPKKETVAEEAAVQEEQNSEKITIGDKEIEIKGISKKDADKIKNLAAMLGALGGMMQGGNQVSGQEKKAEQDAKNAEADKEFDEMSKDLDMYTK